MREGVVMLAVYSLGLGVPFILTALAINKFFAATGKIRRYYHAIEVASGALLVVIGVLLFTDRMTMIVQYLTTVPADFLDTLHPYQARRA